jgi:hypothetical protein
MDDILIELLPHEVSVHENEGLLWIKSEGDDILYIRDGIFLNSFKCITSSEQKLFIVCNLYYQWYIKGFL